MTKSPLIRLLKLNGVLWYSIEGGKLMSFLKLLPLILKGKQVADVYQEETGKCKPWYVSRRFAGLVILLIGSVIGVVLGTDVIMDEALVNAAADQIIALIGAVIGLYGFVLKVIGWWKRQRQP